MRFKNAVSWIPVLTPFNAIEKKSLLLNRGTDRVCLHENMSSDLHFMILYLNHLTKYKLHYLTNRTKFIYIISGDAKVEIYEGEGENLHQTHVYLLGCGDVFHIPKTTPHRLSPLSRELVVLEAISGEYEKHDMQMIED
jgi:cupin fold WbuC family metalloprotein